MLKTLEVNICGQFCCMSTRGHDLWFEGHRFNSVKDHFSYIIVETYLEHNILWYNGIFCIVSIIWNIEVLIHRIDTNEQWKTIFRPSRTGIAIHFIGFHHKTHLYCSFDVVSRINWKPWILFMWIKNLYVIIDLITQQCLDVVLLE